MDLRHYGNMDPPLLYGILNMKLRNDYRDLVRGMGLDRQGVGRVMYEAGYRYRAELAQFRPQPSK